MSSAIPAKHVGPCKPLVLSIASLNSDFYSPILTPGTIAHRSPGGAQGSRGGSSSEWCRSDGAELQRSHPRARGQRCFAPPPSAASHEYPLNTLCCFSSLPCIFLELFQPLYLTPSPLLQDACGKALTDIFFLSFRPHPDCPCVQEILRSAAEGWTVVDSA